MLILFCLFFYYIRYCAKVPTFKKKRFGHGMYVGYVTNSQSINIIVVLNCCQIWYVGVLPFTSVNVYRQYHRMRLFLTQNTTARFFLFVVNLIRQLLCHVDRNFICKQYKVHTIERSDQIFSTYFRCDLISKQLMIH